MSLSSRLKNLFSDEPADPTLSKLSQLRIPKNIVTTTVTAQQCYTHLYLLDHFVSTRSKVVKWAEHNRMPFEPAWTFYINKATERFIKWFDGTHHKDLKHSIPPLDVLMVWHALLQTPKDHLTFVNTTLTDLNSWDWDVLLKCLEPCDFESFEVTREMKDTVTELCGTFDILSLLDTSAPFVGPAKQDQAIDSLLVRRTEHIFRDITGSLVQFEFDFYEGVEAQLEFANKILNFSWHRMYPTNRKVVGVQFQQTIERYKKFMTMMQFSSRIRNLEADGPTVRDFIPTLDIDFVWRTHMTLGLDFRRFSWDTHSVLAYPIHSLSIGLLDKRTAKIYGYIFGEEYSLCLCWHCVNSRVPRRSRCSSFEAQLLQESSRRYYSSTEILLSSALKQCKECGDHRSRGCKGEDAFGLGESPISPELQRELERRPVTVQPLTQRSNPPRNVGAEGLVRRLSSAGSRLGRRLSQASRSRRRRSVDNRPPEPGPSRSRIEESDEEDANEDPADGCYKQ